MREAERLRQALRESLPEVDHAGADPDREPAFTYVPPSHAKALDPDVSVAVSYTHLTLPTSDLV